MTVNELAESIERLHEKFELIGDCDFLDIITMVRQQKAEIDEAKLQQTAELAAKRNNIQMQKINQR